MKFRWLRRLAGSALIFLILAIGLVWLLMRASLPWLDGRYEVSGMNTGATVDRDQRGSVTITAANRLDLARATGYAHAQDRFFQMDLMRRSAAGELAEVFGSRALDFDRQRRVHRMRHRARQILKRLSPADLELLQAYSDGVNSGFSSLRAAPFEYLLLRHRPRDWRPEDSVLVALSMYFNLQTGTAELDYQRGWLSDCLPPAMVEFLLPPGTEWDAPMIGQALPSPPLPSPAEFDARDLTSLSLRPIAPPAPVVGSNNWAMGGAYTRHGSAMVADDMHLGLRLPHTWYHLRLLEQDQPQSSPTLDITGVSLPGLPFVIVGSNRQVAWGFTYSYGDYIDLITLQLDGNDPTRYRTADGFDTLELITEVIQVSGAEPVRLVVRESRWGPVVEDDHMGRPLVWRWVAHDDNAVDVAGYRRLERATDVALAAGIAQTIGIPGQNFVAGDRSGRVAWTLIGRIPLRSGDYDSRLPSDWSVPGRGWQGWLSPTRYPLILESQQGRLWTANNRVADAAGVALVGDGGYALGARAAQIRDRLQVLHTADEEAMLAIHLDDEALFLRRWRRLLLSELNSAALMDYPARQALRESVVHWSGRAAIDDAGYRLVREFRDAARALTLGGLTAHCPDLSDDREFRGNGQFEGTLWRLLSERPAHLLPPQFSSWRELLLQSVDQVLQAALEQGEIDEYTWGRRNTLQMTHPLSGSLPGLGRWLRMAAEPLPGDRHMPRVQSVRFGASQRLAVSPGYEEQAYLQLPGGQSGHPLSPFFDRGHEDWATGVPTPLLPGPSEHQLQLVPPATDTPGG
ncbi:MAG: penicillin acylase family protein [Wenzhouxiangellaceae bacterium]